VRSSASAVWVPLRRSVLPGLRAQELGSSLQREPDGRREGAKPFRKGDEQTEKPEGCITVFVRGLQGTVTREDLVEVFGGCGKITRIAIPQKQRTADQSNGGARGFAHVTFADTDSCDKAMEKSGTNLKGRKLQILWAEESGKERKQRASESAALDRRTRRPPADPRVSASNQKITQLGRDGEWAASLAVLAEEMPAEGVIPNLVSYNAAMSALTNNGQWRRALDVFEKAREKGVKHDTIGFSAAISACNKGGMWRRGLELLEEMEAAGRDPNEYTYTSLIAALDKGGKVDKALELLETALARKSLKPNAYLFTAAIHACEKQGRWHDALGLLERMDKVGVKPSLQTYSAAISACEKVGQAKPALGLMERMEREGLTADVILYSAAMSACGKAGQWESAERLLEQMVARGVEPDVIAYSTLINAFQLGGQWARALEVFGDMEKAGVTPNLIAYSAAIHACDTAGEWRRALGLLERMKAEGLEPDAVAYNYVLAALSRAGRLDSVLELLQEVKSKGKPRLGASTYCTVVKACGDNGEWETALGVVTSMGAEADDQVVRVLITALEKNDQHEMAKQMRAKLEANAASA